MRLKFLKSGGEKTGAGKIVGSRDRCKGDSRVGVTQESGAISALTKRGPGWREVNGQCGACGSSECGRGGG